MIMQCCIIPSSQNLASLNSMPLFCHVVLWSGLSRLALKVLQGPGVFFFFFFFFVGGCGAWKSPLWDNAEMALCSPRKGFFSCSEWPSLLYQSKLVEAISGTDIAKNFIKRKIVGYLRDACVIAVKVSSSLVKPHRTLSDEVVYGLIVHITVRT